MPMGSVTLRPGVNTQKTKSLNEAGVSVSNLIRYKDGLIQKIGGWTSTSIYSLTLDSTIREIHAWQGATGAQYLAVGATASLSVIQSGSLSNITPTTRTDNYIPNFSVSSNSNIVTINSSVGSSASLFDVVFFNTPLSIGNTFLSGAYQVNSIGGSSSYTILSSANNSSLPVVSSGILPIFDATAASGTVTVTLPNNNYQVINGLFYGYYAATTVGTSSNTGSVIIQGRYQTKSIVTTTSFTIQSPTQSSTTATATMNSGSVQIVYHIGDGPVPAGAGYGIGPYGYGGYGQGTTSASTASRGTAITATDWSMDNWGEILLACPYGGPIYTWSPDSGFVTASVVATAPFFNGGLFISMPQQILVCWNSTQTTGVIDPLIVRWSDAGDYTNFVESNATTAGSFRIPTGSMIAGGLQAPNHGVIWTDVDVWIMQYVGGDAIFNFTRVGSGCGLIGRHAAGVIGGTVYWCGTNNFYMIGQEGMRILPCEVWDFIFQNLSTANVSKIRCAPNSTFSEISWFFPSSGGTGENDSYVKYNVAEKEWDYGSMSRNAWIDVTALGNPIATDTVNVYQHEIGYDNTNQPITSSFESGYWAISDGNEMCFVDWFIPDMKFGTYSGSQTASVQITFNAVDYLGDTPRTSGPYTFTSTTEYLTPRLRGRFMSISIQSVDAGSFWRIGKARYRFAVSGRR